MSDPDEPAVPGEEATPDRSFAPMRGRPVLPRALDTRGDGAAPSAGGPVEERTDVADRTKEPTDAAIDADDARPPAAPDVPPTEVGATGPGSADPEPAHFEPADPERADREPGDPEPEDPEPADLERADPEPAEPEPAVAEPAVAVPLGVDATDAVPIESEDDPDDPSSLEHPALLDEPARARRRFVGRGVVVVGARALVGAVGVLIAVGVIVGATALPAPLYSIEPPATVVSPVAAAQQRVCPGPLLRLGDDEGQGASVATSVGRATSSYRAGPRDAEAEPLAQTENTVGVAPEVLTLPPGPEPDDGPTALAGSQTQEVNSGDLVGLAAAECAEARGETWLVGGSTDVGRTTLITLSNPTTVLATVDLAIFGTAGEVSAPGTEGIVVPPGSQRIFSLAGFAPQLISPVVRVVSRGGLVVANLQQTTVRTLDPGGVDIVGAANAPARVLGIAGLLVSGSDAITDAQGDEGADDLQTTLRLFAPGDDTTVAVTISPARGNDGPAEGAGVAIEGAEVGVTPGSVRFELDLPGGQVSEVPVLGLSDGEYSVTLQAATPIVAGARVSTLSTDQTPADDGSASAAATDFTWLPAGMALNDETLLSVAPGPSPVLRMLNPTGEAREVTVTVGDTETTVVLAAGEAVPTGVEAGEDISLRNAGGMLASVTYAAPGRIAAFGITSPGPASTDLTIVR